MGERIEQIAAAFEKSSGEFISLVEGLNDAQWRTPVADEKRTVGVVAHHVADGFVGTVGAMTMIANGQDFPVTMEMIDQGAVDHIQKHGNVTKAEALAALRENAAKGAGMIRALTDAQLDNTASVAAMGGQQASAVQLAQYIVQGHIADHTKNIKAALGI